MADEAVNTGQLNQWVDPPRAGGRTASDELLVTVGNRLARELLGRFPEVYPRVVIGDVLGKALLRFLRAQEQIRPNSVREMN